MQRRSALRDAASAHCGASCCNLGHRAFVVDMYVRRRRDVGAALSVRRVAVMLQMRRWLQTHSKL